MRGAPTASPATGPTAPPALPMPWSDGGPMLWPLPLNDGAAPVTYPTPFPRKSVKYGFLDAAARVVAAPRYGAVDYCLDHGRPSRVVALRGAALDVLALDGTVTRTIQTKAGSSTHAPTVCCLGDTVAAFAQDQGVFEWQQTFRLDTGKLDPAAKRITVNSMDKLHPNPTDEPPSPLPRSYPVYAGGGWAESRAHPERYLNLTTRARRTVPGTTCRGTLGFLVCGDLTTALPMVYDQNGHLTDFADVEQQITLPNASTAIPFAWAVSGNVQGYIDRAGAWHFQEPLYQSLTD
ncbi:MAG: hypothetical protein FWD74_12775 [Actinomycetia bacterium]|nr:hypothetical protein [Actinomycetes bacterium]